MHRLDGVKTVHMILTVDHRNQSGLFADIASAAAKEGETIVIDQRDWWNWVAEDLDDLGRYRRVDRLGNYATDGSRLPPTAPEQITVYDGEKTVAKDHTTGKDGVYVPGQGFPTAVISDGRTQKVPQGPLPVLAFPTSGTAQSILKCLEAKAKVTVRRVPGEGQSYELTYASPGSDDITQVIVDASRGWAETKSVTKARDGELRGECSYSYVRTDTGFWVLKNARCRSWPNNAPAGSAPVEEIYTAEEVRINEPIPEETFRISLDPNTLVTDRRYGLDYRVGAEKAFDADIQRLAAAAGAPVTLPPSPDRRWVWLLIAGNVALVASIVLLISWYRQRRTGTEGA